MTDGFHMARTQLTFIHKQSKKKKKRQKTTTNRDRQGKKLRFLLIFGMRWWERNNMQVLVLSFFFSPLLFFLYRFQLQSCRKKQKQKQKKRATGIAFEVANTHFDARIGYFPFSFLSLHGLILLQTSCRGRFYLFLWSLFFGYSAIILLLLTRTCYTHNANDTAQ